MKKKLREGEFDSYANMGQMGTEQEFNTNEQDNFPSLDHYEDEDEDYLESERNNDVRKSDEPRIFFLVDLLGKLSSGEISQEEANERMMATDLFDDDYKQVFTRSRNEQKEKIKKNFQRFL